MNHSRLSLYTHLLVRYSEIFLKGGNRAFFEQHLISNISKQTDLRNPSKTQGRIIYPYSENHHSLRAVFGLTSYSPSLYVEKEIPSLQNAALSLAKKMKGRTFKIQTKRSDKRFPLTSPQTNQKIGMFIESNTSLRFDLKNPDFTLFIEINQTGAFLFTEIISCFGGLPIGSSGKVLLLLENEASILAGLKMAKRGCSVVIASMGENLEISLLQKFNSDKLQIYHVSSFEELEKCISKEQFSVLVSGQTFNTFKKYPASTLTFRPLISYSEKRIQQELHKFNSLST